MEQKVRICLQFSNPNQGGGPPSSRPTLSKTSLRATNATILPPTTTADVSDQHERISLLTGGSPPPPSITTVSANVGFVTNDAARGYQYQQTERCAATKAPMVVTRRQRATYTLESPSPTRRQYTTRARARFTLFFPAFPRERAVSFRQTSLPNYLPVLAPNAFVKRWNKLVDSSQIPARVSLAAARTRRPRKLPLTNVLFIPRHGSCTPHSTNFITRILSPFVSHSLVPSCSPRDRSHRHCRFSFGRTSFRYARLREWGLTSYTKRRKKEEEKCI